MAVQYIGLKEINGPLIALDNVTGVSYDEVAEIQLDDGTVRTGRVVQIDGSRAVLQVFEGTKGLSLRNTRTRFTGKPMEMPLSEELLGSFQIPRSDFRRLYVLSMQCLLRNWF